MADTDDDKPNKSREEDILQEAKEAFKLAKESEEDNRNNARDDIRFARLGEQWPEKIRAQRERDSRPILTINKLNPHIRQVVNDARQNKPSIKIHPVDNGADPETAEIFNGLIRNIEVSSDAEVAYDTATESAVSGGVGYLTVDLDYAFDDTFDLDIFIRRVPNPFSIYGDPYSRAADSSDWNFAFQTEWLTEDEFKREYPGHEIGEWEGDEEKEHWCDDDGTYLVAKYWVRKEKRRIVLLMSDGRILDKEEATEEDEQGFSKLDYLAMGVEVTDQGIKQGVPVTVVRERETRRYEVERYTMTANEILRTEKWPGKYIPIIPVYGDEVTDEKGERHLRSLIHDAKDAQRMFNYWRTTSTEMVALAPRIPYIGPKGSFKSDVMKWSTSTTENWPFMEYDVVNGQPPSRQPLDTGVAAGALQESLNAADDIKSAMGMFDASLGAQGNETSGRAILARRREGDVSTFHFQDNMARAIRHTGRILIDLIPKIYDNERIIRVIGADGKAEAVQLKKPVPVMGPNGQPQVDEAGNPITRVFDLTVGKYDLTVTTGPSYTTQREETREQMVSMAQAFPPLMNVAGDLIAKSMDWPGADEIAKRFENMLPPQAKGGLPPEVQQMMQQGQMMMQQKDQMIQQMQAYINKLEADRSIDMRKAEIDQFDAETDRFEAYAKAQAEQNVQVPDTQGQYGDFAGMVDLAKINKLNAEADQTRMRTLKEAVAQPVDQSIPTPGPMRTPR